MMHEKKYDTKKYKHNTNIRIVKFKFKRQLLLYLMFIESKFLKSKNFPCISRIQNIYGVSEPKGQIPLHK